MFKLGTFKMISGHSPPTLAGKKKIPQQPSRTRATQDAQVLSLGTELQPVPQSTMPLSPLPQLQHLCSL